MVTLFGYLGHFCSSSGHLLTFQGHLRSALAVKYAYFPPRRSYQRLKLTVETITQVYSPLYFLDYRPYDMDYAHFELNRIISMLVYFVE